MTGELEEQRARKDEQITLLQSELVSYFSVYLAVFQLKTLILCYWCSQEKSLSSIELVKGKADVLEVRVNDLQDELSAKTIEAQRVMVMHTSHFQMDAYFRNLTLIRPLFSPP